VVHSWKSESLFQWYIHRGGHTSPYIGRHPSTATSFPLTPAHRARQAFTKPKSKS
jgi:hypothetical protein